VGPSPSGTRRHDTEYSNSDRSMGVREHYYDTHPYSRATYRGRVSAPVTSSAEFARLSDRADGFSTARLTLADITIAVTAAIIQSYGLGGGFFGDIGILSIGKTSVQGLVRTRKCFARPAFSKQQRSLSVAKGRPMPLPGSQL
jgi:hypothetical protein